MPPVVVVGKGERADLQLPPELENRVAFHPWLRYPVRQGPERRMRRDAGAGAGHGRTE